VVQEEDGGGSWTFFHDKNHDRRLQRYLDLGADYKSPLRTSPEWDRYCYWDIYQVPGSPTYFQYVLWFSGSTDVPIPFPVRIFVHRDKGPSLLMELNSPDDKAPIQMLSPVGSPYQMWTFTKA
jgi:hypothetical protein